MTIEIEGGGDPTAALATLAAVADTRRVGTPRARGRTTHYVATLDVAAVVAQAPREQRAQMAATAGVAGCVDSWRDCT